MEKETQAANEKSQNWAEMSDEAEEEQQETEKQHVIKPAKKKAAIKGFKNKDGDYVVTKFEI
jgi:hypothetical protein